LIAGEWITAVAELNRREASLVVNDGIASKGLSVVSAAAAAAARN